MLPTDKDISHAKWLGNNNTALFCNNRNTVIIIFLETKGILDSGLIESLAERVKEELEYHASSLPLIICAASLAQHGLLGSMSGMDLRDVDLTSAPAEHLASLAYSVTGYVYIDNVSGCGLVTILDSVNSKELEISNQSLGSEETQALVQAMESRVEQVVLDYKVTLEIRVLMEYSGQGKCMKVWCDSDTADRYREQLRAWAKSRNWKVTGDWTGCFYIERNLVN